MSASWGSRGSGGHSKELKAAEEARQLAMQQLLEEGAIDTHTFKSPFRFKTRRGRVHGVVYLRHVPNSRVPLP
eukprot:1557656-Pyramimonas_sp.AAC.1